MHSYGSLIVTDVQFKNVTEVGKNSNDKTMGDSSGTRTHNHLVRKRTSTWMIITTPSFQLQGTLNVFY